MHLYYGEDPTPVLNNLSITIEPREKVSSRERRCIYLEKLRPIYILIHTGFYVSWELSEELEQGNPQSFLLCSVSWNQPEESGLMASMFSRLDYTTSDPRFPSSHKIPYFSPEVSGRILILSTSILTWIFGKFWKKFA